MFLETSALTGENVEEAFVQCARKILNKIESGMSCSQHPYLCVPQRLICQTTIYTICISLLPHHYLSQKQNIFTSFRSPDS